MSYREYATYFINAVSTSSNSVDASNNELKDATVTVQSGGYIAVYGDLTPENIQVLENNFEIFDDLTSKENLQLLAE